MACDYVGFWSCVGDENAGVERVERETVAVSLRFCDIHKLMEG
jgi:hypothetical protein